MRIAVVLSFCLFSAVSAQTISGLTPDEISAEDLLLAQSACKQPPPDPDKLPPLALGEFHLCAGNLDRAAAAFKAAATPDADKRLVAVLTAQRRRPEAIALAETLLKAQPNDPARLSQRAALLLASAKPAQLPAIIADLRKSLVALPTNPVAHANLARALVLSEDLRNAHDSLSTALTLAPEYVPALASRASLEFVTGQFSLAVSTTADILRLRPQNVFARLLQGAAYLYQGRVDDAEAAYTEAVRLDPANREALYQLGFTQFRKSSFAEARKSFEKAYAATPPDLRGLMGLVEIDSAEKQFDQALQRLDAALKSDPANATLLTARANTSVRAGRLDEAIVAYRKLIATAPKDFKLQMSLAEVFRQKGDSGQAAEVWKAASLIQPTNPTPLINQAMAVEQAGRLAEAAALYERILKLDGSNVIALNNYANYLANQGKDLNLALRHALRAAILASGDPSINDTLGYVYLKRKEPKEAIKIFERLTADFPNVALFHIHYADALRQNGDAAAADRECATAKPAITADAEKADFKTMCPAIP